MDAENKVRELRALIDKYWELAYAEGKEGRDHDTEDGAAQATSCAINEAIRALAGEGKEPVAMLYLQLTDAMGYDSGKDGIEFSPEEWAAALRKDAQAWRAARPADGVAVPAEKFKLGDTVRKTKGSQWSGIVVGTYSTALTPEGYAVESSTEKGSVQIYPAGALELAATPSTHEAERQTYEKLLTPENLKAWGQPAAAVPVDAGQRERERWLAVREGHLNAADAEYFTARLQLDNGHNHRIFYAGFCKGYDSALSSPAPVQAEQDKFDEVLLPFLTLMRKELHANTGKGDRPGWLQMDASTALLEVYHHLAKLQKAVRNNDGPGILEYAADVANMSMMVLDICGGIDAARTTGETK
jgi:hypothetical protein